MAENKWKDCPWVDPTYVGPTNVSAILYKNKWNATIGLIFGRYVKRYFMIRMDQKKLCCYDDIYFKNGHDYAFDVLLAINN